MQQDRLFVNWREGSSGEAYPRYRTPRRLFEERLGEFTAFVTAEELGSLEVTQAEVHYINAVEVGESGQGDLGMLLRHWGGRGAFTVTDRLPLKETWLVMPAESWTGAGEPGGGGVGLGGSCHTVVLR